VKRLNIENAIIRYRKYGETFPLVTRNIMLHEGNFITSIIGPRRSGKTSLMLLYKKTIDTPENNKIFINCEDIDFVGITVNDLDGIEETLYRIYKPDETKNIYLFIDEAQNFPQWAKWLRTLFDQQKFKIYITGSTADLSLDNLPSELRGRAVNTLVLPFSFKEYLNAKNIPFTNYMNTSETSKVVQGLSEYLDYGGYPEIVKSTDPTLKHTLLQELYATVIQRDLIEKYNIRKTAIFRAFINSLFGSACRNISIPTVTRWFESQGTQITNQTALNYLNYAQCAFLFFLVYPYSRKIKERNTKPKLYVSDSGILGLFESNQGKKLENAVLIELIRRQEKVYYYKSPSADVDFVLTKENKTCQLIQVCYSLNEQATYAREIDSLLFASENLNCDHLTVITFNEEKTFTVEKKVVKVMPVWKWFLSSE
jgi:predicted AAA+ superfamily ATPase